MVPLNFKAEEIKLPCDYNALSVGQRFVVRQRYVLMQKGLCEFCEKPLDGPSSNYVAGSQIDWSKFPDNFLDHPIHLHHDHETGLTIGAVHARCNAFLWQYCGE